MDESTVSLLDQVNACHDDDPSSAAAMLRRIDPAALPAERLPGLAFLLNHVLGEKLGAWPEAHAAFEPLLRAAGAEPPLVLRRQAAAAARLGGDDTAAQGLRDALAAAAGLPAARAEDVIALTAASFRVPALASGDAAQVASAVTRVFETQAWEAANPIDAAVAACANNMASGLLERPAGDLQHPALRAVVEDTARLAERFWLRAGNWVHHERAAYLRAMVANALGEAAKSRSHAMRALALLDQHDTADAELVDRAFIELERARACRDLGFGNEAQTSLDHADALAAAFNDAGLDAWFAKRRAELGTPAARGG